MINAELQERTVNPECCALDDRRDGPIARNVRYRRVLWCALAINAAMFLVELVAGLAASSVSLQADALDFLADSGNYGISLFVVGMAPACGASAIPLAATFGWRSSTCTISALNFLNPSTPTAFSPATWRGEAEVFTTSRCKRRTWKKRPWPWRQAACALWTSTSTTRRTSTPSFRPRAPTGCSSSSDKPWDRSTTRPIGSLETRSRK